MSLTLIIKALVCWAYCRILQRLTLRLHKVITIAFAGRKKKRKQVEKENKAECIYPLGERDEWEHLLRAIVKKVINVFKIISCLDWESTFSQGYCFTNICPRTLKKTKTKKKNHSSLNFNLKFEVEDNVTFGMPRVCELILPHADRAKHLQAVGSLLSGAAIGRRRVYRCLSIYHRDAAG